MTVEPVAQRLGATSTGEDELRVSGGSHEDLHLVGLAAFGVRQSHRQARKVHEQLLAGPVMLDHAVRVSALPLPEKLGEAAVAVTVRMLLPVLLPQQSQSHALPGKLGTDAAPIRKRTIRVLGRGRRKQQRLQRRVAQILRRRPNEPCRLGSVTVFHDSRAAEAARTGHLAGRHPVLKPEPEHLSYLSHCRTSPRHSTVVKHRVGETLKLPNRNLPILIAFRRKLDRFQSET